MHKGMAIVNARASNVGRKESFSPEESVREILSGRDVSQLFDCGSRDRGWSQRKEGHLNSLPEDNVPETVVEVLGLKWVPKGNHVPLKTPHPEDTQNFKKEETSKLPMWGESSLKMTRMSVWILISSPRSRRWWHSTFESPRVQGFEPRI